MTGRPTFLFRVHGKKVDNTKPIHYIIVMKKTEIVKSDVVLTEIQVMMVDYLIYQIITPIEQYYDITLAASSGFRSMYDYERLVRDGYNPSRTSDHFFGLMPFTSGAVDVYILGKQKITTEKLFKDLLLKRNKEKNRIILGEKTIFVGQMILEKRKTNWIHFANPRRVFYSPKAPLPGYMFLQSEDNGKTFKQV